MIHRQLRSSPRPLRRVAPAAALALALAGCAAGATLEQADALLRERRYDQAAAAYAAVAADAAADARDRTRAAVGEARTFLARGDLVGAEARLRRLPDGTSAKWYHLAELHQARGERAPALDAYRRALDLAHGGDTAARLALLVGGEARSPEALEAAAPPLERAGRVELAGAVREAVAVWREQRVGAAPAPLVERFAGPARLLAAYPVVRVIRALLLDAAGETGAAEPLWDLSTFRPPVTPGFAAHAAGLRAAAAAASDDPAAFERALAGADPSTAARLRAEAADGLAWRGDLDGALAHWEAIAAGDGEGAARAHALRGRWLRWLGRETQEDPWTHVEAAVAAGSRDRAVLEAAADHSARSGDLLGAGALLEQAQLDGPLREAARLLGSALAGWTDEGADRTSRLVEAAAVLAPTDPTCAAVLAAGGEPGRAAAEPPGCSGAALAAYRAALLRSALAARDLGRAAAVLPGDGPASVELERALHGALLAVVVRPDGAAAVAAFLGRHGRRLSPGLLALLAASHPFRAVPGDALDGERGLAGLPVGHGGVATLAVPARRLAVTARLRRVEGGWSFALIGEPERPLRGDAALARLLGAQDLASVEATFLPEGSLTAPSGSVARALLEVQ